MENPRLLRSKTHRASLKRLLTGKLRCVENGKNGVRDGRVDCYTGDGSETPVGGLSARELTNQAFFSHTVKFGEEKCR